MENSRYFADPAGKIVYLTGLHTSANLQDQGASDPPPKFDYDKYLENLRRYDHNFIRLWVWEQARWAPWADGKQGNPKDWFVKPNPYSRPGPREALDGKPKFDLEKFVGQENALYQNLWAETQPRKFCFDVIVTCSGPIGMISSTGARHIPGEERFTR